MNKYLPLLFLLLLVPLLSGCFGGAPPLPENEQGNVLTAFKKIDGLNNDAVKALNLELRDQIADAEQTKQKGNTIPFLKLQRAYTWERLGEEADQLNSAVGMYRDLRGSPYDSVGVMRIAQISKYREEVEKERGSVEQANVYRQEAIRALEQLSFTGQDAKTFIRDPAIGFMSPERARWELVEARTTATAWLDPYYRDDWRYKFFDVLVTISGGKSHNFSFVLAIVLVAVIAKVITTPFSVKQFRSMRAMQLFQPELKKLQEKYKDDKKELARAQMELMREHKINPASSCLPMILQLVILWQVYYAIRHYLFHFQGVSFLYLSSLANPDTIIIHGSSFPGPILLLYAISMYFTQKLLSMPSATPEQAQQQKLMAYMMPVMMLLIMQSLPAAFILYWFLQNVLMTGHQYLIMRPHRAADAAAAAAALHSTPPPSPGSKPETPPPAPPEAIQRLTEGRKQSKKKRKRRY